MPYVAEISRTRPTAFLFIVDRSGSMSDKMSSGKTKAEFVADALNRTLMNLITRCTKSEGTRNYFHVGVIAYGGYGIQNGFTGDLSGSILNPISAIEENPVRIETRKKRVDDGAGGLVETNVKFPVWFEAQASGGTPMSAALEKATEEIALWCEANKDSYPPTVLHITDGESTDGNPEDLASVLQLVTTNDGPALVLNIHVSTSGKDPIKFPNSESGLPEDYSKMLFRMSSSLPEHIVNYAKDKGYPASSESRGFMFNAEAAEIIDFFDIGTRASQLR